MPSSFIDRTGLLGPAAVLIGLALVLAGCQTQPSLPPPPLAPIAPPPLIAFADGQEWVLATPMTYTLENTDQSVVVPLGFVTDLASTPRAVWSVLPPFGYYQKAAIVHDYLYWKQECTKKQADKILYLAMKESNVSAADRLVIYNGVRFGGNQAWKQNQRDFHSGLTRFVLPDSTGHIQIGPTDLWSQYRATHSQTANDLKSLTAPAYCALADRLFAGQTAANLR